MIIVPTIRNSGSHFVMKLLGVEHPWRPKVLTWRGAHRATQDSIVFDHIFPQQAGLFLSLIAQHTSIVPLRHPKLTAKSWIDRGHDLSGLVQMWEVMAGRIAPLEPFFLPIDTPGRAARLSALNQATGMDLQTDWKPEGQQQGNAALRHWEIDAPPEITRLCERIEPFLKRFY